MRIVDDERRGMRPQPPCARRVTAAWGHLRRCRSSPMHTASRRRTALDLVPRRL